ncbi:MAG: hypothetical protein PHP23_05660 [Desulfobacterales bacterium]|nr:hypothetical protein [Desulfobacterales bacterium]MDD4072638.1 hypothetical protein [Desulfobacterales bacterium]MDD4391466.1 hypothetical protein [Desulfobacterales bacterium]
MNKRQKWFLVLYAVFVVIMAVSLITSGKAKRILSKFTTEKYPEQYYVYLEVIFNVDARSHVIITCYIPCGNSLNRVRLRREVSRIKNDILENMSGKMAILIKERKFEALKSMLLDTINRHTDTPVTDLYFDRLVIT